MGKVLEFKKPSPDSTTPAPDITEVIEAETAAKQINKLFTKKELEEIRRDLTGSTEDPNA
jgi:hypothetical protein